MAFRPPIAVPAPSCYKNLKAATPISFFLCLSGLAVLLVKPELPDFPNWMEPAHFSSSLILAIAIAACITAWRPKTTTDIAWLTLVSGSLLVVLLEMMQLAAPGRNFELGDILFGFAGVSSGAIISYLLIRLLGHTVFSYLVVTLSVAVVTFLIYLFSTTSTLRSLACEIQQPADSDWRSVLINDFSHQEGFAANNAMGFCVAQNDILEKNEITYSATLRLTLNGLAAAVREQQSFAIGIQFTSTSTQAFSEIASITWYGRANSYFANINRSGKHLKATLQFNGGERTSTSIANGVELNELQEMIIQYDGNQQTTWLNGEIAGTETGILYPPKTKNAELVLNIGQTAERKWWVPFEGEIKAIYIGTQVLQAADINSVFSNEP